MVNLQILSSLSLFPISNAAYYAYPFVSPYVILYNPLPPSVTVTVKGDGRGKRRSPKESSLSKQDSFGVRGYDASAASLRKRG